MKLQLYKKPGHALIRDAAIKESMSFDGLMAEFS
jgi:hypothetical protein